MYLIIFSSVLDIGISLGGGVFSLSGCRFTGIGTAAGVWGLEGFGLGASLLDLPSSRLGAGLAGDADCLLNLLGDRDLALDLNSSYCKNLFIFPLNNTLWSVWGPGDHRGGSWPDQPRGHGLSLPGPAGECAAHHPGGLGPMVWSGAGNWDFYIVLHVKLTLIWSGPAYMSMLVRLFGRKM